MDTQEKKIDREERKARIRHAYENPSRVNVIPPKERKSHDPNAKQVVAPYCRVSTMNEEQAESYEIQQQHYLELIESKPGWVMYDMYADEGISATSVRKRENFLRMIADCEAGKIDMIITKSISRFARNAVDCLVYTRKLKNLPHPVGVYFETENINTIEQNGETMLGILASFAQRESEEKSVSIKWGIRNRFKRGIPHFYRCLGYTLDEKRVPHIVPEEADIVRIIYDLYSEGVSIGKIARQLNDSELLTINHNYWSYSTVRYILENEKYCGDVMMQKTVCVDIFTHRSVRNDGIVPRYELEGYHDPIVPKNQWLNVQEKLKAGQQRRKSYYRIRLEPQSNGALLYGFKGIKIEEDDHGQY